MTKCSKIPLRNRPVYWDKYDEPQYIGDVLFNIAIHIFPFTVAFVIAIGVFGVNYVLTYDGVMTTTMWGVGLTLG